MEMYQIVNMIEAGETYNREYCKAEFKFYTGTDNTITGEITKVPTPAETSFMDAKAAKRYLKGFVKDLNRFVEKREAKIARDNAKMSAEAEAINIPVIREFIESWKTKVIAFYMNIKHQYAIALADAANNQIPKYIEVDNPKWSADSCKYSKKMTIKNQDHPVVKLENSYGPAFWIAIEKSEKEIVAVVSADARIRLVKLVSDVTNKGGSLIKDAAGLHMGKDGNINGFVICENDAKVKIETISAGGHNIQCYHYRMIINRVK